MTQMRVFAASLVVVALAGTVPVLAGNPFGTDPVRLSIYQPTPQVEGVMGLEGDESGVTLDECGDLCYCGPCWTVGVGAVIKQRNRPPKMSMVIGAEPGAFMSTDDLDVGWGYGPWFEIIRHLDGGVDFEIEYFSIDNYSASAHAQNGTPLASSYWEQFEFDDIWATYSNELYSLEFNLKWPLCESGRWKGIAGFHWIELKEEFAVAVADTFQPPVGEPVLLTNTGRLTLDNHLYGFQLGAEGIFWQPCPRLWFEGLCKAGIYGNHANRYLHTEGDMHNQRTAADDCQSAFVSEIALTAVWKPCCNMKVFAGYEAFHLKEVATIHIQDKCDKLVVFDHAFFHGFLVGVEVSLGKRSCCPASGESCATCE